MSYLYDKIVYCLDEARRIFQHNLALGLPNIPVYDVKVLVNNWDNTEPQKSFINNPRNADSLNGGNT